MRKRTHLTAGVLFAIAGYLLLSSVPLFPDISTALLLDLLLQLSFFNIIIMLAPALIGALLPDILDPPFTPNHRKYAHSRILLLIFIIFYLVALLYLITADGLPITILYYFLLGYISHMFLDSLTPAGLW